MSIFSFRGYDGENYITGAQIITAVDGTPGTNGMPGRLVFNTTADGASSPTERMRIDSDGDVGIGVTPAAKLDILHNHATEPALRVTQTGVGNAFVVEDSASPDSTPFVIDASGAVVIGGTAKFTTATTGGPFMQSGGSVSVARFIGDANPNRVEFIKSRNTTFGSAATIIQSGDTLGDINFQGADGTAFIRAASIQAQVDGTPGTNSMPGRLVFSTSDAATSGNPKERMRIDSEGRIGIGGTPGTDGRLDHLLRFHPGRHNQGRRWEGREPAPAGDHGFADP
jgi:hypothetical protein